MCKLHSRFVVGVIGAGGSRLARLLQPVQNAGLGVVDVGGLVLERGGRVGSRPFRRTQRTVPCVRPVFPADCVPVFLWILIYVILLAKV